MTQFQGHSLPLDLQATASLEALDLLPGSSGKPTTKKPFTFDLNDTREFLLEQLELDQDKGDEHLTLKEYRWHVAQLIQVEQAEALKRIASALEKLEAR